MEGLDLQERLAIDKQWQAHWYKHIVQVEPWQSILDVGAGTGYGLTILSANGIARVDGFDVVEISQSVPCATISDFADSSYELVTAIDVIEHVVRDGWFLAHLLRIAKRGVFISTPNWNVSKAQNPHHVREYTPAELEELIATFGFTRPLIDHRIWVSNHECVVTTRESFDPDETWHNFGVLLLKEGVL